MFGQLTINPNRTITVNTGSEVITYGYAGFLDRVFARLLDTVIIILPSFLIPILPSWLYWALQHSSSNQRTIGQSACGIKLLSLDGSRISFAQATGRFFANLLNVFTFLLGYFMFFFNDKNQCLHDYLSGTVVVKQISVEPIFN